MKKYFSKDWKFYWRYDSPIGNLYGVILNRIGLIFLTIGRKCLRRGGGKFRGKYYQNCSWCGVIYTDAHMHISRKGNRCGITTHCYKKPLI